MYFSTYQFLDSRQMAEREWASGMNLASPNTNWGKGGQTPVRGELLIPAENQLLATHKVLRSQNPVH